MSSGLDIQGLVSYLAKIMQEADMESGGQKRGLEEVDIWESSDYTRDKALEINVMDHLEQCLQ